MMKIMDFCVWCNKPINFMSLRILTKPAAGACSENCKLSEQAFRELFSDKAQAWNYTPHQVKMMRRVPKAYY